MFIGDKASHERVHCLQSAIGEEFGYDRIGKWITDVTQRLKGFSRP
jgi:hypothetical protein